jgi:hypothetical protein
MKELYFTNSPTLLRISNKLVNNTRKKEMEFDKNNTSSVIKGK